MITLDHLRDAWMFALFEINSAIYHLESGAGVEAVPSDPDSQQAVDAWLATLRRDRLEYSALLTKYPS